MFQYSMILLTVLQRLRQNWSGVKFTKHDDVIKWKHFLCYWPFVPGIHRSLVNSPHKGQWRGALMFSLICTELWCFRWVNNREAGDLTCHRAHYDVIVMDILDFTLMGKVWGCLLWWIERKFHNDLSTQQTGSLCRTQDTSQSLNGSTELKELQRIVAMAVSFDKTCGKIQLYLRNMLLKFL